MDFKIKIQDKMEELNKLIQQIQFLQQELNQLSQNALKLEGAIAILKELDAELNKK
jgi:prefoldin subunit 5